MRNPWKSERYYGRFSDLSTTRPLTTAEKAFLEHTSDNDGTFWMALEDYLEFTDLTTMNYDVAQGNWSHASHLSRNDTGSPANEYSTSWCPSCYRYTGYVTNNSGVSNKVHAGLHTWRWRGYGDKPNCVRMNQGSPYHGIRDNASGPTYIFSSGDIWLPEATLAPGETRQYTMTLDLDKTGMTPDWAFSAWGEDGAISISVTGSDGNDIASDSWPFVQRDDNRLPTSENEIGPDPNDAAA